MPDFQATACSNNNTYFPDRKQNGSVFFEKSELLDFSRSRCRGLSASSNQDIKKALNLLWQSTKGELNQVTLNSLANLILERYHSQTTIHKMFIYNRNFLNYLYKTRLDTQILAYLAIFQKPKARREIKLLTDRIITKEDIIRLISILKTNGLPEYKKINYFALILFLSYTGQRPQTATRLTAGQFRTALSQNPPVLVVEAKQDKNRLAHYVPLHPHLIGPIEEAIRDLNSDELIWSYPSIRRWLLLMKIPLNHCEGWWTLKDFRKGFEQISDEIGFTDANKNFIMLHCVSGVNWTSHKQFRPESVFKNYIERWGKINFH